jgi:hypothetical protein
MKTKYQKYQIEWPNGNKEVIKVPFFFGPIDVVKRLQHCMVEILIDSTQHAQVENVSGLVQGPKTLRVNEFGKLFL